MSNYSKKKAVKQSISETHKQKLISVLENAKPVANNKSAKIRIFNEVIELYETMLTETDDKKLALKDSVIRIYVLAYNAYEESLYPAT